MGGDAFVLYDQLKNIQDGKEVSFTAFLDKEGKVVAKDVRYKKEGEPALGEYKGKIISAGGKFGFIKCDELKKEYKDDVFVLKDELKAYRKGNVVKFTAFVDTSGKLQAKDLKSGLK